MNPVGDFEKVGEFGKFFFILTLCIAGLVDSGGVVLVRGEFYSTHCKSALSLASLIQKENSLTVCLQFSRFFCRDVVET